jgi:hypothetical protein
MSRSVCEEHDSSRDNNETRSSLTPDQESSRNTTTELQTDYAKYAESLEKTEGISRETERIASLSSEITELLSSLQNKVETSAEKYKSLELAADAKKEELKQLYEIEASAASLASLVESLQFRREQEEEEYRRMWATEKEKAQNVLKEELEVLQQEFKKKQEEIEKELLLRESILKAKEKECDEIIQDIERFISGLGKRVQGRVEAAAYLSTEELLAQSSFEDEIIRGNGSPMSVEERDALMEASEAEDSGAEETVVAQTQNTDSVTIM